MMSASMENFVASSCFHFWRSIHYQQAAGIQARTKFRADQAGFDRLTETHFVGDE